MNKFYKYEIYFLYRISFPNYSCFSSKDASNDLDFMCKDVKIIQNVYISPRKYFRKEF